VALEEAREAIPGHADAVLGQGRTDFVHGEAGLRRALVRAPIAAHRLGRDATLTGETRPPSTGARQADPEAFGSFLAEGAGCDGMHHALAQIERQGRGYRRSISPAEPSKRRPFQHAPMGLQEFMPNAVSGHANKKPRSLLGGASKDDGSEGGI
jgi:hypothetical protein